MAEFDFNKVDEYVQSNSSNFSFLKLADDGWEATVRFMYGPGELFKAETVHNISEVQNRPKYVPCLREFGQPLESCPLCQAGSPVNVQYYIFVYVLSVTKVINGVKQPEEPVNQVMMFQRGKLFKGSLDSAIRQCKNTPLVNNVFRVVRCGKANNTQTTYMIEHIKTDDTTLESLGGRPDYLGSYVLPKLTYDEMLNQYVYKNNNQSGVVPRTVNANYAQPAPNVMQNPYQAPTQAPRIPF